MTALDLIQQVQASVEPQPLGPGGYLIKNRVLVACRKDLKELDLFNERITSIHPRTLPAGLETLNLRGNKLTDLKPGIFPVGLKWLDLNNNKLTDLKPGVFPAGLEWLILSDNKLTDLKPGVFPASLERLYIFGNMIPKEDIQALEKAHPNLKVIV